MSDFAIDIKIRNARIRRALSDAGYKSVGQFCRLNGFDASKLGDLFNLKKSPTMKSGKWIKTVVRLAEVLKTTPDELFSESQKTIELRSNESTINVSEEEARRIAEGAFCERVAIEAKTLEQEIEQEECERALHELMGSVLTPRERAIVESRYSANARTLAQIGDGMGYSPERIRQMESKALRKLRSGAKLLFAERTLEAP